MIRLHRLQQRDITEYLDRPGQPSADLRANLRDIRFLNRWFGGVSPIVSTVRQLCNGCEEVTILDAATGSADIPTALYDSLSKVHTVPRIVAVDISDEVLSHAVPVIGTRQIQLFQADVRSLPFEEGSFDIVICCLALHHFSPAQAGDVLQELWRVTRRALIVSDLTRSHVAYASAWLATHFVRRSRMTRHDGPVSVLRAYTPAELSRLAHAVGIQKVEVRRTPFFRQLLTAMKDAEDD